MTYKTIVVDYAPKTKKLAAAIEEKVNEKALDGWEPLTFSVTPAAKAIILFSVPEDVCKESPEPEETAEAVGDAE